MLEAPANPSRLGIDHLQYLVEDLDGRVSDLQRLGFTLSPRGMHSPQLGTANHTIVLQQSYLEIITVVMPTPHNQRHRDLLLLGEGCHAVAIATASAAGTKAMLAESGIQSNEPIKFTRSVQLPDQRSVEAGFEVVRPSPDVLTNGAIFYCKHFTPEAVWVPEWMSHENTAQHIEAVVVESSEPASSASAYSRLFPGGVWSDTANGAKLTTENGALEFMKAGDISSRYGRVGVRDGGQTFFRVVRIGVTDLPTTVSVVKANGIPYVESDVPSIIVPPQFACGVVMEFTQVPAESRNTDSA